MNIASWAIGAGVLLAIIGPLLLLFPLFLLLSVFKRIIPIDSRLYSWRWPLALVIVAGVVFISYLPGWIEFKRLCSEFGEPRIYGREQAEGFYLDDITADSFGMRYLNEEGFQWIEAKDNYRNGPYVRIRLKGKEIVRESIQSLQSKYVVSSRLETQKWGITIHRTSVAERIGGRLLAESHSIIYRGGPLSWILGVWGMQSCPNPMNSEGSRRFRTGYHLAREVLGRVPEASK